MQQLRQKKDRIGVEGEQIACKYLIQNKYVILAKNWRYRHLEIDIIALKDNVLHIIEVKTRTSLNFERPQDAVTVKKQKFLVTATNAFLETQNFNGEIQFDIISVLLQNGKETITYIPDAFYPMCN